MSSLFTRPRLFGANALLIYLAVTKVLLEGYSNLFYPYGIFRDEFYYIACGLHLDWGYVDHPPLIALIARITTTLFGLSPLALRLLPALSGAAAVILTGLIARRLGGGKFAQALSALAVLAALYWVVTNMLSTIPFDHLFWLLTAYFVLCLLQTDNPKYWLAIGATIGLGLMTKNNIVFLAAGLAVGVVLTPAHKYLRMRWLWLGVLLAFVIVLPNLIWEVRYGFPTLEFIRNASNKNSSVSPLDFISQQILLLNPVTLPLWLTGLVYYARSKTYRLLAWLYIVPFLILTATQAARPDYLSPAYPWLFAAGAVVFERWIQPRALGWLKPVSIAALIAGGLILLPLGLPVMPPEALLGYLHTIGLVPAQIEKGKTAPLPQYFSDRLGWPEMTASIVAIYNALPPGDQSQASIFVENYGEAAALNYYGPQYHLPPAVSGHNNYYLWGPGDASGQVVISIGVPLQDLQNGFDRVEQVGLFTCTYCTSEENNLPIYVARGLKHPLRDLWPTVKHYG